MKLKIISDDAATPVEMCIEGDPATEITVRGPTAIPNAHRLAVRVNLHDA